MRASVLAVMTLCGGALIATDAGATTDCASEARLSKSHFSRAFKATFGTTVARYVLRRRVEEAKRLMLVSHDPLSQIALACGFGDQAHYCRVFRDVVGISPNSWRRQNMS